MNQSKIIRSIARGKKTTNKFVPLIKIDNDKVYAESEGIEVLRKISSGSLLVVAFEQLQTQIPFKMFECYELNNPRNQTGIWISQNYIQDDQYGYKLICLVGHANTTQDTFRIHMFNSILSSVLIINVYPGFSDYNFLKTVEGRIIYSKIQSETRFLANELANIVILERVSASNSSLLNDQNRIKSIEKQQGISGLSNYYRSASFYQYPQDEDLKHNKKAIDDLYGRIISIHLTCPKDSKKLYFGPVLAEYLPQIVKQYNSKYQINFSDCLNRIEIDESYEAYMEALEFYNQNLRRKFNGNQPVEGLHFILQDNKQEAIEQYKSKTRDIEYLTELANTINEKENKINRINDALWHQRNIEVLKRQSKNLLAYAQNPYDLSFDVKKQAERIKQVYSSKAGGRTKQEDLNGFLQKLSETLGEDNFDKNRKIHDLEKEKRILQDRLKKLQKKGCCKKCQIM